MATNENSIEGDIALLEQQLAEKRAALEQQGTPAQELPSDKEIIHQVVGEQIQQQIPQYQPALPNPTPATPITDDTPSYMTPELNESIQQLVSVTFSNGLDAAIKNLGQANNPALTDAFHDAIVDELFDELTQRKQLLALE